MIGQDECETYPRRSPAPVDRNCAFGLDPPPNP